MILTASINDCETRRANRRTIDTRTRDPEVGIHPIIGPDELDTNFRNDISKIKCAQISDVDDYTTTCTVTKNDRKREGDYDQSAESLILELQTPIFFLAS